ncbi:DUF411 domain-containing protein [Neptunomonas qingdaonensis]|uniref:Uncharacterized conserved protein n=1 Tax=Neptunomonas qingdaonensis TaxID=1045558 RepID=A0A1I2MUF1_9GAMM|nr:DUF411 domain-containing protein [Neptunomonas qingdaonensis]SFF94289.1 Uncharacterized conserved protein [Neptunomonas qingdaonensis]
MSLFFKPAHALLILAAISLAACSDSTNTTDTRETKQNQLSGIVAPEDKASSASVELDVYKSPTCGCCASWIEHIEKHAFTAKTIHPADLSLEKSQRGIAPMYRSCHTAVSADGYVFEGHVPAKYITQFLSEKPKNAIGLSVPDMPAGSPGMEMGDRFTPYSVLLLKKDGSSEIYAQVNSSEEQH